MPLLKTEKVVFDNVSKIYLLNHNENWAIFGVDHTEN